MSPREITSGSYTLTVPASPGKASSTSSKGLGAIGIAVTGVPIFNDEEGMGLLIFLYSFMIIKYQSGLRMEMIFRDMLSQKIKKETLLKNLEY